jgi:transcription factor E2F3
MAKDPIYAEYAYMTFDDIKMLSAESNDTLIAVKAPLGSKIEIPDPEQLEMLYKQFGEPKEAIKKY